MAGSGTAGAGEAGKVTGDERRDDGGGRAGAPKAVRVGDPAPDFALQDHTGRTVTLREFRGRTVVLFFYPRDHTTICTAEACEFRDRFEMFRHANAVVIGLSADSIASHQHFAQQHGLPFHLLADEEGKVRTRYGVPRRLLGLLPGRVTYVIDHEGIVRHVTDAMFAPGRHIREALQAASLLNVGSTRRSRP